MNCEYVVASCFSCKCVKTEKPKEIQPTIGQKTNSRTVCTIMPSMVKGIHKLEVARKYKGIHGLEVARKYKGVLPCMKPCTPIRPSVNSEEIGKNMNSGIRKMYAHALHGVHPYALCLQVRRLRRQSVMVIRVMKEACPYVSLLLACTLVEPRMTCM